MIFNIDASQVELDHALSKGLLGYPDVLGKTVEVIIHGNDRTHEFYGTVTALGPIGFMLRHEPVQNVFEVEGSGRLREMLSSQSTLDGHPPIARLSTHRFFPWTLVVIAIVERTSLVRRDVVNNDADAEASVLESLETGDGRRVAGVPAPESIVGAGEITEEMVAAAIGHVLDLYGQELGLARGHWLGNGLEPDEQFRGRLVRRLRLQRHGG